MNDTLIHVDEHILLEYIKENITLEALKGSNLYELVSALFLRKHLEIEYDTKCLIGLLIKSKFRDYYPKPIDKESIKTLIESHVEENHDIDFTVSSMDFYNPKLKRIDCWAFQMKRFGLHQKYKGTESFLKYMEKIKNKYQKTDTTLAIFFDGYKGMNFKKITSHEVFRDFPFREVMFLALHKNDEGKEIMRVGAIYPFFGYKEYNPKPILKSKE